MLVTKLEKENTGENKGDILPFKTKNDSVQIKLNYNNFFKIWFFE